MRYYKVIGRDERTGEVQELELEATDREAALLEAQRLGLIAEDARVLPEEAPEEYEPTRYGGLLFCGRALIVLAFGQVFVSLVMSFTFDPAALVGAAGAIFPAALGYACLALRDIAIHTVPVE